MHSSGPFGGPFSDLGGGGGSSKPREPPLATALSMPQHYILGLSRIICKYAMA